MRAGLRLFSRAQRSLTTATSPCVRPDPIFVTQQTGAEYRLLKQEQRLAKEANKLKKFSNQTIKGAILDISGTTADALVFAPAVVFCDVFEAHGVRINPLEARGPMGLRKDIHIAALLDTPNIAQRWREVYGRHPQPKDVEALFSDFVPMQEACIPSYSEALPGVASTLEQLRMQDIGIGLSTGFTRSMLDIFEHELKKQDVFFDTTVAGDEVKNGARPTPHMVYKNMDELSVHHPELIVKVDDTVAGVGEGISAGTWTVCVTRHSNEVGKCFDSYEHYKNMPEAEFHTATEKARATLAQQCGAHYVIPTLEQLPEVIADINVRLQSGETPTAQAHDESDLHLSTSNVR